MILAPIVVAGLLAATLQALSLAWPATSIAPPALLRVTVVLACAWAATLAFTDRRVPAAAGAFGGTVVVWAAILVRNDSAEVGTVGAVFEGAHFGTAIALPRIAAFLLLRRLARLHR